MADRVCPINGDIHKYFIFKTYEVYELDNKATFDLNRNLYKKVEYAVLGCNCSSIIKKPVELN